MTSLSLPRSVAPLAVPKAKVVAVPLLDPEEAQRAPQHCAVLAGLEMDQVLPLKVP